MSVQKSDEKKREREKWQEDSCFQTAVRRINEEGRKEEGRMGRERETRRKQRKMARQSVHVNTATLLRSPPPSLSSPPPPFFSMHKGTHIYTNVRTHTHTHAHAAVCYSARYPGLTKERKRIDDKQNPLTHRSFRYLFSCYVSVYACDCGCDCGERKRRAKREKKKKRERGNGKQLRSADFIAFYASE